MRLGKTGEDYLVKSLNIDQTVKLLTGGSFPNQKVEKWL
jgi:hypothetical protein